MSRKFKDARLINKLKMTDAAEKLGISQPTLSAWEAERKSPSIDGLEHMADLYGVTTDFLLGRTEQKMPPATIPISMDVLPIFHGKPVWSSVHGWLLVNSVDRVLTHPDGHTIAFCDSTELFVQPQLFTEPVLPSGRPLQRCEIHTLNRIWVEPLSPDAVLRNELRGWYMVQDRFVQNEYGNRFYLDNYNAKWLAFDPDTPE